jgi:hypothetical protein
MKKILLVNPHDTEQSGFSNPPLGLLYLAGTLRVHAIEDHFADGCSEGKGAICMALEGLQPNAVGIDCLPSGRNQALDIAAQAGQPNSKTHMVLGGTHPTIINRPVLDHYAIVDAIVRRDGRIVFRATIRPDRVDAEMLQGLKATGKRTDYMGDEFWESCVPYKSYARRPSPEQPDG